MTKGHLLQLRALARRSGGRLRVEAGLGLVEAVIAMSLFLVVGTAMADVLSSSATSHGFTVDQTLAQEAADAQIEDVRALPYDSVGIVSGNPPGTVVASEPASAVGVTGLPATVTTSIEFVGDGIPDGYNSTTNYKEVTVSVTRNVDGRNLATESTYIAPPTRAPYGGISQVALGVIVTDVGDNQPVPDVPIALTTGPSAPRNDTTDTNGGVLFAGMTANTSSGSTQYYNVIPSLPPGYVEMSGDVKQAHLGPGQITNLSIRVYQPATIYVHLTSGGSNYTGNATVTVTPKSGTPQNYSVGGDPGGSYSIPNITPNAEYTVTACTLSASCTSPTGGGLVSKAADQWVPNDYPDDLTSSFTLDLAAPTGTLSITALNGSTPIAGVAVTVTGGPSGVTLTGTTDATGVVNFPSVPAGTATYTITGTFGAATFQQTGVTVATNQPTAVTLGVSAGSVKVSATDGASHALPGATLTLAGPNGFSAVGTTDGTGTWTFPNVGTGSGYSLTATDGAAQTTTTGISVATGVTTNVVVSLSVGTIKVTVTDGSNPLQGIQVTLTGPNSLVVIGSTDSSGSYSFANVGAGGGYTVTAADGAATATSPTLSVTAGGTTNANLTLPTGSIQATVTVGGSPLPGAKVTVTGPNAFSVTQTANTGGVAVFNGIGVGSGYTVTAYDGGGSAQQANVSVAAAVTTNVSIDLPTGSLHVIVDAGTTPLPGTTVTVTGPNSFSATGTTDSNGGYTFTGMPAGPGFTVTATDAGSSATQSSVTVTQGSTTSVTLQMPTGAFRVVVQLGGTPLAGQTVTVTGPNSYSATGQTDSTGLAVFPDIPAGTGYTVSTTYGSTISQTGVAVSTNNHTNVLLTIPAGSLKVIVQNQSGTTLQGASVSLTSTNGITAPAGTTGTDGSYTFSLPVGTGYKATASYGAGSITSAAQAITSGTTTSVTLTIGTGSIKATVQNGAGTTYTNASLVLTGPNGFTASAMTGTGGIATFANVPVGAGYSIVANYAAATTTSAAITVPTGSTPASSTITIPTGSITVTVTAGGSKVGGSAVTMTYPGGFSATGTTATSGAGLGTVTLTNVPAGAGYSISATDSVGTGTTTGASVTAGSTTSATVAIPVGSIAVTVAQGSLNISGATVTVTNTGGFSTSGTTSGSGTVTLTNIPAGTGYTVTATLTGAGTGTTSGVAVTSGNTTATTVNLPTGSIVVTVKNGSGTSLTGASLTLTGPNSYSASGSTGSGSTYTFPNVPISASGYTVNGTLGAGTGQTTGVIVSSPSPAKAATLTIQTGSIKVTVTQGGTNLNGAPVTITYAGGFSVSGTTGGGTVTLNNIPIGSGYTVTALSGAGSGTATSGAVTTGGTLSMSVAITVGTLTITVEGASPTCTKLGNVGVTLTGAHSYSATATTSNVTGPSKGAATFSNVPSGSPYTATDANGDSNSTVSSPSSTVILSPQGKC